VGPRAFERFVVVESKGDAVVVHKVTVNRAMRKSEARKLNPAVELVGDELLPYRTGFPRRAFRGTVLLLQHPEQQLGLDQDPYETVFLDVHYSFSLDPESGHGGVFEVELDLSDPPFL